MKTQLKLLKLENRSQSIKKISFSENSYNIIYFLDEELNQLH